jgi:uncharacterized membrane protein
MDTIDTLVIFAACLAILNIIVQLGADCAFKVWQRTAASLDEVDLLECNCVPATTGFEALLITAAALVKMFALFPLTLFRRMTQRKDHKTPEARLAQLRMTLRSDILLAVFSMITGYPERAGLLYIDTLRERLNAENPISAKMVV